MPPGTKVKIFISLRTILGVGTADFFQKSDKILGYKLTIPSFYISAFRHIFSHNSQNVYNYMI